MRRVVFMSLCWVLLSLFNSTYANPHQQGLLLFDEPVEGSINDQQFRQIYAFEGRAGQVINLQMARQSDDLDPYLLLFTQAGDLVAYSDDARGRDAEIAAQLLPADGTYTVIATRFGHEHGTTTGNYILTLSAVGTAVVSPASTASSTDSIDNGGAAAPTTTNVLRYGDTILGEITDEQPYVIYQFAARRGDVINFSMTRINGDLDPFIDLFGPDGSYLLSGDDDDLGTLNAAITNFTVPADGVYYVQATRYGRIDGDSSGLFSFAVSAIPVEQLGTRPSNARVVDIPSITESVVTAETQTRFFQIEAQRGDIISVIVTRTSDDLVPRVSILRSDLATVGGSTLNEDEDTATIGGVTIQDDGVYYISVTRDGGTTGETSGAFAMQLERRRSVVANGMIELVYGGQVIGTISDETVQETFAFAGRAGDEITISMTRTNGDLDALLTLRDSDGKQLVVNDDGFGAGSDDARLADFILPADGIYVIEASRFERGDGETSGDYILQLSAIRAEPEPTPTPTN